MRAVRALVVVTALVLATSVLGAFAAPVLLPSLWWAASSGGLMTRWAASLAAGVLAAEVAMLVTVLVVRGNGFELMGGSVDWSWRWVIPVSAGLAAGLAVLAAGRSGGRPEDVVVALEGAEGLAPRAPRP